MSPPFQDPPRGGGFCQAITGSDTLHGTDMGTKNQEKNENGLFEISASRGVTKVVTCLPFDGKKFQRH